MNYSIWIHLASRTSPGQHWVFANWIWCLCNTDLESWYWFFLRGRDGQQAAMEFDKLAGKGHWGQERICMSSASSSLGIAQPSSFTRRWMQEGEVIRGCIKKYSLIPSTWFLRFLWSSSGWRACLHVPHLLPFHPSPAQAVVWGPY